MYHVRTCINLMNKVFNNFQKVINTFSKKHQRPQPHHHIIPKACHNALSHCPERKYIIYFSQKAKKPNFVSRPLPLIDFHKFCKNVFPAYDWYHAITATGCTGLNATLFPDSRSVQQQEQFHKKA